MRITKDLNFQQYSPHTRPKLAFVAQPGDIVPPIGGASISIHTYETARRLTSRYDVTIFSRKHQNLPAEEIRDGVRYIRINIETEDQIAYYLRRISDRISRRFRRPIKMFSSHYLFQPFYYVFYILRIALAVRRERFDIVQIPNFTQFVPIIRLLNPKARIVFVIHCEWLTQMRPRLARRRLAHMDAVLGVSHFITQGIRDAFPACQSKCATLHNGTDLKTFTPGPRDDELQRQYGLSDGETILFVGRITPEKGLHVLIDAMRSVVVHRPQAILLVIGPFSSNPPLPPGAHQRAQDTTFETMKEDYRRLILERVGYLGEHVRLVGVVPPAALPAFYRTADILVHPALWQEPFGLILVEAMACARAVISTPVGGIPEIVRDGENGRLVPPNDPDALAEAMIDMLASSRKTIRMGERGRQTVEREFSWDRVALDLDAVYRSVLHLDVLKPAVTATPDNSLWFHADYEEHR